ncbi:MAG TPA: hypothetical protein DIT28_19720 [Oxalobacteraceae bacterium]|nr:hypothetical protein [Oxalobacteraceae bacterium]
MNILTNVDSDMDIDNNIEGQIFLPVPSVFLGPREFGTKRQMTADDFAFVYAQIFEECKGVFERQGFFSPIAFIIQLRDDGRVGLCFPTELGATKAWGERGKAATRHYIEFMLDQRDAVDLVVRVSECWATCHPDAISPPANDPERIEVLFFNLMDQDAQAVARCEIVRDAAGCPSIPERGELEFMRYDSKAEGRFVRRPASRVYS